MVQEMSARNEERRAKEGKSAGGRGRAMAIVVQRMAEDQGVVAAVSAALATARTAVLSTVFLSTGASLLFPLHVEACWTGRPRFRRRFARQCCRSWSCAPSSFMTCICQLMEPEQAFCGVCTMFICHAPAVSPTRCMACMGRNDEEGDPKP